MVSESSQATTVDNLIDQLSELRRKNILDNDKSRKATLGLAKKLVSELDDPLNVTTEMMFSPCLATTVKIAVDLNLYALIDRSGEKSISTTTLSEQSGGDALLISRILRLLASIGFVKQVDREEWAASNLTKVMAKSPIMAGYRFMWGVVIPSVVKSPQYFREVNFTCPTQPTDGIIQYALQTKYNVFDYMAKIEPDHLNDFNHFMGNSMGARKDWLGWYPVQEKVMDGWQPDTALLVDVGGGKGHDLQAFQSRYPEVQGSLILQDLPQVLSNIQNQDSDDGIERQAQDFFSPNQVKGAKTYFMHHIIHDWSDEYALKILSHLRDAMTPEYSRLLIHDPILPDVNVSAFQGIYDITMMTFSSGMERNRAQWTALLEHAGFEVVGFWMDQDQEDADGIIEAVLGRSTASQK